MSFKRTIVIGSGKGGVGKSTVAVNLAVALAQSGLQIGLLDADIYGPSIPIMMGLRRMGPRTQAKSDGQEIITPISKFGVKVLSIGFFLEEANALMWRGPMLHGVLQKMLQNAEWGELDLLLIDLPPGTGDVPMSLSQLLKIDGAIVVCTPQEVAILDAIKAINTFHQLEIPLLGLIENMSGFIVPSTGDLYHIFGEGKVQELSERFAVPILGSIPLLMAIRQGSDDGYPAAFHQGNENAGSYFGEIAKELTTLPALA